MRTFMRELIGDNSFVFIKRRRRRRRNTRTTVLFFVLCFLIIVCNMASSVLSAFDDDTIFPDGTFGALIKYPGNTKLVPGLVQRYRIKGPNPFVKSIRSDDNTTREYNGRNLEGDDVFLESHDDGLVTIRPKPGIISQFYSYEASLILSESRSSDEYPQSASGLLLFNECGVMKKCAASVVSSDGRKVITAAHCVARAITCSKDSMVEFFETALYVSSMSEDLSREYEYDDEGKEWSCTRCSGIKYLTTIGDLTYPIKITDAAILTLDSSVSGGYFTPIDVSSMFFDPISPNPSIAPCPTRFFPNLCCHSDHDVTLYALHETKRNHFEVVARSNKTAGSYFTCDEKPQEVALHWCASNPGDSGAPLVINNCPKDRMSPSCMYLVGVNKGAPCSLIPGMPSVFTPTGEFKKLFTAFNVYVVPFENTACAVTLPPTISRVCACIAEKLGDGRCDANCNNAECSWDKNDCPHVCPASVCSRFRSRGKCISYWEKNCYCLYNRRRRKCLGI